MSEPNSGPGDAGSEYGSNEAGSIDELRTSAASSAKWGFVNTAGNLVGRLGFSFVLARIIGPESFGVVAQATIFLTLILLLLDQGFGAALVQKKHLDRLDVGSVGALNLALALALSGLTIVAAPALAAFFDTPQLTAVLRVLCISAVVKGLTVAPMAVARRKLRFREIAIAQVAAVLVGGTAGLVAAELGADYWALVVQTVVTDSLLFLALVVLEGPPRLRGSWDRLRPMWSFSIGLLGTKLLGFVGTNADNLIIAWRLSAEELAYYALAYRLLRLPLQMFASVANDVALPIFSRLQDDHARLRAWYVTGAQAVALVTWPVMVLFVVGAPEGIPLLLGDEWEPAVRPLQILAIAGIANSIRSINVPLGTAVARVDVILRWQVFTVVPSVIGFSIGVRWGIEGVAMAFTAVQLVMVLPATAAVGALVGTRLTGYLAALVPPAVASLVLAGVWLAVDAGLDRVDVPVVVSLGIATIGGLVAYGAIVRFAWPRTYETMRDLAARARTGRSMAV